MGNQKYMYVSPYFYKIKKKKKKTGRITRNWLVGYQQSMGKNGVEVVGK